jgi:hypothetical protein
MFKKEYGDWTEFQRLPNHLTIDFHPDPNDDEPMPYWARMEEANNRSLNALKVAQEKGIEWVVFTHGWSTSRMGKTTSRSQVRKLMRGKEATPYIVRSKCIQHHSVFVAAIRQK